MTDTAQSEVEFSEPVLDLDAMLADLRNDFQEPPEGAEDSTGAGAEDAGGGGEDLGAQDPVPTPGDPETSVDDLLPPGTVKFGDEVLEETEARALLELNRRAKTDPEFATRLRQAVLNEQKQAQPAEPTDDLPAFIDPDDQQAVYFYRQNQRIIAEQEELKRAEAARLQQAVQAQESQRVTMVRDAFRDSMREFRTAYPSFELADLNAIANKAAAMGLLENPEKVGGTLKGGIFTALEAAAFATPEFREKATGGATVTTQDKSSTRKQKSSALSSSTGSVVRTQSQEPTPTNRKEVMAGALNFLRSGAVAE